jgi:DnaJ-class molecular chaperone
MTPEQAFRILSLPVTATQEEVKTRFRHLAMTTHPDKAVNELHATTAMQELNLACDVALEEARTNRQRSGNMVSIKCTCDGSITSHFARYGYPGECLIEAECDECGGTKKIEKRRGLNVIMVACPKCAVEKEKNNG